MCNLVSRWAGTFPTFRLILTGGPKLFVMLQVHFPTHNCRQQHWQGFEQRTYKIVNLQPVGLGMLGQARTNCTPIQQYPYCGGAKPEMDSDQPRLRPNIRSPARQIGNVLECEGNRLGRRKPSNSNRPRGKQSEWVISQTDGTIQGCKAAKIYGSGRRLNPSCSGVARWSIMETGNGAIPA